VEIIIFESLQFKTMVEKQIIGSSIDDKENARYNILGVEKNEPTGTKNHQRHDHCRKSCV
jgi:hypothetical protein